MTRDEVTIIVPNGELIGKGYHARVGQAHAEIQALESVKDPEALNGAHMYVTLEPCAHHGRTGSCAMKLASLPLKSVTYGLMDPNPLVSGRGAAILREAGKVVHEFEGMKDELEELAEMFLVNMREKRPFIAMKIAASIDGKVALRDGSSQWITGEGARSQVHYLRGCHDAVLSGVGTFLRDGPRLNSRLPQFAEKPQRVVLLDPEGKSYPYLKNSELMKVRAPEALMIVTGPGISAPPVGRHVKVTDRDRDFDLKELLTILQEEGIYSLLVEAGPITASSFLRGRLVDRMYLFMAPKILGDGLSWSSAFVLGGLDEAVRLEGMRVENYDQDLLFSAKCRWP